MSGFDLAGLRAAVAAQGRVVRVVIAGFKGSSPRETGASMLVWRDGQSGTIGGGALEFEAAERARGLSRGEPCARDLRTIPLGPALGQCCGGSVSLLWEVWDAGTLVAVFGPAPGPMDPPCDLPGFIARPVARAGAEGGARSTLAGLPLAARRAAQAMREGRGAPLVLVDGWIVEAIAPPRRPLFLYGAGHVGRAIVRVFEDLPFEITWVDDAVQRFPQPLPACARPVPNPADAVALAPAEAIHLVLTYSHALDLEICHRVLSRPFGHLGLIGSATKAARFRKRLGALGHAPAQIARLDCPIGDRALGKEPSAIAIGVAAQMIRLSATQETRQEQRA